MGLMKKKRMMKPRRNGKAAEGRARRLERRAKRKNKSSGGSIRTKLSSGGPVAKPN